MLTTPSRTPLRPPVLPARVPRPRVSHADSIILLTEIRKGHGGDDVAVRLQDVLHLRVLDNPHFPSDIPQVKVSGTCIWKQARGPTVVRAVVVLFLRSEPIVWLLPLTTPALCYCTEIDTGPQWS